MKYVIVLHLCTHRPILYFCSFFYDALSNSVYIVPNGRITDKLEMILKVAFWPI